MAVKPVTIALLGAAGTGKKNLSETLIQALASMPAATFPANAPLRWQITTDSPLQRLLEQVQASASQLDGADLDTESTEFQAALVQQRNFDHSFLLGLDLTPSKLAFAASKRCRAHPHGHASQAFADTS